jgi:hypothetical protein
MAAAIPAWSATSIAGVLQADPGPCGLALALTYALPFAGVQGDLILTDPNFSDLPMEILRFNGDGTVIFYAANRSDSLAFVASPPSGLYDNLAIVSDIGPEDLSQATYTPADGQPGFDPSNRTYVFFNGVPEPGTMVLVGAGLLILSTRRQL